MSDIVVRRVQVGMVVVVAIVGAVLAGFAFQASAELDALDSSPVCVGEQPESAPCRRELSVTLTRKNRAELTARTEEGQTSVVRLASNQGLRDSRAALPDTARATFYGASIMTLDWGAGVLRTEDHPESRRDGYLTTAGALGLMVVFSLAAAAWSRRRASAARGR